MRDALLWRVNMTYIYVSKMLRSAPTGTRLGYQEDDYASNIARVEVNMTEQTVSADGITSAMAVANAFLDIQDRDPGHYPPIDQMKLQKLVYYAHAWWLVRTDEPLYGDDVEAWPWGPVVRNVYHEFSNFGRKPVKGRGTELVRVGNGPFDFRIKQPDPVPANVESFLQQVWDSHKHLSGVQLSNATHGPGEPWSIVLQQYGSLDGKPRIPNDLIRDVFRDKRAKQATAA